METLETIGLEAKQVPDLVHVRDLEYFDGPLLSELSDKYSNLYIEKLCSCDQEKQRTLIVRSDEKSISEYLSLDLTMFGLMIERSSNIGWLCDYYNDGNRKFYVVEVSELPKKYLPSFYTYHDPITDEEE